MTLCAMDRAVLITKLIGFSAAAFSGILAHPINAQDAKLTVWCRGFTPKTSEVMYYSPNFTVESATLDKSKIQKSFETFVSATYGLEYVSLAHCDTAADPNYINGRRQEFLDDPRSGKPVKVEWRYDNANAAAVKIAKPTSPGSLTITDNGEKARTKAWDNVLLQAKRDEAARQASIAAQTAESKAKYKQIMDKAIAEAKKRGRSQ